jgi:hypothetical protein
VGFLRRSESDHDRLHRPLSDCERHVPQHICILCRKARSSSFQARHPITPGEIPILGICSRPNCAKALRETRLLTTQPLVRIQINHYHHLEAGPSEGFRPCTSLERLPIYTPDRAELPGNCVSLTRMTRDIDGALFATRERFPPPINKNSKPQYISTATD